MSEPGCPICKGAPGAKHAPDCAMECPLCHAPCGTGHLPGCLPPAEVSPDNALVRWLRKR